VYPALHVQALAVALPDGEVEKEGHVLHVLDSFVSSIDSRFVIVPGHFSLPEMEPGMAFPLHQIRTV